MVDASMVSVFVDYLLFPLLLGIALSFVIELFQVPQTQPIWRRPWSATCLHIGGWIFFFCFELVLFQRPWFALGNVLAWHLLLIVVNNAKYHAMREPFLFYDFEYFLDAIKHPRLYLPFLGVGRALLAVFGLVLVIVLGRMVETSILVNVSRSQWWGLVSVLLVSGLLMLVVGYSFIGRNMPVSLDPKPDYVRLGLIGFIWYYAKLHFAYPKLKHAQNVSRKSAKLFRWVKKSNTLVMKSHFQKADDYDQLPDIIVVQSESFFDPRPIFTCVEPSVLAEFDEVCRGSVFSGALQVPAWGANTIRTEAAFLTGLAAEELGVNQFSPYRYFLRHPKQTLAHQLQSLGYTTVCVHPYPASFYQRDRLYPQMGFDHFIDITAFKDEDKVGQYTSDAAVTEQVRELLGGSSSPMFIYVITMENHGPLHLETPEVDDKKRFYIEQQPEGCDDLTVYLKHLKNASLMSKALRDLLIARPNGGLLCWYGDHVPIMSNVYSRLGGPNGDTCYFIWSSDQTKKVQCLPRQVSELSTELLSQLTKMRKKRTSS